MSLSDFDYDNKHNITEKVSESMTDNLQFCGVSVSQPGLCTTASVYIYMYIVCLTLLASFFLPSHLSFKHVHVYT